MMRIHLKSHKKGFSLVEILVVIAVIGILASVILVSLNAARSKGSDVKIISDVHQSRTALESGISGTIYQDLYSDTPNSDSTAGSLTTSGPGNDKLTQLMVDATAQGGVITFVVATNDTVGDPSTPNVTAYAVYGQLTSSSTQYFCMDSLGNTSQSTSTNLGIVC